MIGNQYKADLIAERLDTLEMMKEIAWKYQTLPQGFDRDQVEESIRELGLISKRYAEMIARADLVPEKWVTYYEIMEKLYAG